MDEASSIVVISIDFGLCILTHQNQEVQGPNLELRIKPPNSNSIDIYTNQRKATIIRSL